METFILQIMTGIANGGIYAIVGLAIVMIYRSTDLINFAQGEMAMFSTYIAWSFLNIGFPFWAAFAGSLILSFVAGMIIYKLTIAPLGKGNDLGIIVILIGLLIIFNSLASWIWTPSLKTFPSPFPAWLQLGNLMSAHTFGSLLVTAAVLAALFVLFKRTTLGLAMRAVAQNPVSSQLVGLRVKWLLALGWGVSAAIGAVAGMLIAPVIYLEPNMMSGVLLYGICGAILGGLDNPAGAVVGGLIIGVLENVLGAYVIGNELKFAMALAIIVAVLLVRPAGLFSSKIATRV